MGRNKNRNPEPPKAPEPKADVVEAAARAAKGGMQQILFQIMNSVGDHLADTEPVDRMIRVLSPAVRAQIKVAPAAIRSVTEGLTVWYKSATLAHFAGEVFAEAAEIVNRIVDQKGHVTPDEAAGAIKQAAENVRGKVVLIGPMGEFHIPDCAEIRAYLAETNAVRVESTFGAEIDKKTVGAHCCHERVREYLRVTMPQPKAASGGRRSFFQRLAEMPKGDLRDGIIQWVTDSARDPRKLPHLLEALGEIDEDGELEVLMMLPEDIRENMIPLLRARNAHHTVMDGVRAIGRAIKDADDKLGPRVQARAQARQQAPRAGFLARLVRGTRI